MVDRSGAEAECEQLPSGHPAVLTCRERVDAPLQTR